MLTAKITEKQPKSSSTARQKRVALALKANLNRRKQAAAFEELNTANAVDDEQLPKQ